MILPEMLTATDVSVEHSLASQLHVSVLLSLNSGLRAASGPIARRLKAVRDALRLDALDDALRNLDSAWRSLPEHAAILAPIYGRLLSFEARDYDAALRLLQRAIEFTADADVEALIAYALWQLRRPDDARRQLEAALARYCVLPDSLLYRIAGELIEQPAIGAPGWIGRGPNLELVGELGSDATSSALDISLDGQSAFTQLLQTSPNDGRRAFNIPCPDKRSLST